MDLQALCKQGKTPLLTLPCSDLTPSSSSAFRPEDKHQPSEADAPLLLLQLPSGWTSRDLAEGASFVANDQAVSLVVDRKSFSVQKVETSNCWVAVPPTMALTSDASGGGDHDDEPSNKRAKTASGKGNDSLVTVPARLIQQGGEGASFLELCEKHLRLSDLSTALADHVWDPQHQTTAEQQNKGRTVGDLVRQLQLSAHQVQVGLTKLQAIALPMADDETESNQRYALLSEEVQQDAYQAILSALDEVDSCSDYAGDGGLPVDQVLEHALSTIDQDETYPHMDRVIRHCLGTLCAKHHNVATQDTVTLDLTKVAVCIARRLFSRQTQPWEETLFLSRWQTELPGVEYQVSLSMLRGVAIDLRQDDEIFWKYLPTERLPKDAAQRFQALFAEKEAWTLEELQPYLAALDESVSHSELLLQHAQQTTVEGSTQKVYKIK